MTGCFGCEVSEALSITGNCNAWGLTMKIFAKCLLLSFPILVVVVSGTLITRETVFTPSDCLAGDGAVVFIRPENGAKIPLRPGPILFKGKVIGFSSEEIQDLGLKVSVARHSHDRKLVDVRSDGNWQTQKRFSSKGEHTIRAYLIDKSNQQIAETKITITLE